MNEDDKNIMWRLKCYEYNMNLYNDSERFYKVYKMER